MGISPAALLYVIATIHLCVSQHFLRLRPLPSEHLPVTGLKEDPDPKYDPRKQDLSEQILRRKLGSNFDPVFMSINRPPVVENRTVFDEQALLRGPIPNEVKQLSGVTVAKKARQKFEQWLWAYTHCPVDYVWKDLGVRFWPRYVKEGQCLNERSCSLPEGMFCKPDKSVTKTFLRWYCQGFLKQKYCTWIQVQYPIISECMCSCGE